MPPNRVNRGHWPTKEHRQHLCIFFPFFWAMEKLSEIAPNGTGNCVFLLIQTLPTFWATRIWNLRICIFFVFLDPRFLDFKISRFPDSRPSSSYICPGWYENTLFRKPPQQAQTWCGNDGDAQTAFGICEKQSLGCKGYAIWSASPLSL